MKSTAYYYAKNWSKIVKEIYEVSHRQTTIKAWTRCKNQGLEPNQLRYQFLSEIELKNKQTKNKEVLSNARQYISYLTKILEDLPYIVAISDKEGWIIDIYGEYEKLGGKEAGLTLGANWSEESIGNNGIGTCLVERKPVLIYAVEHFGVDYQSAVCFGIPIRKNGEIIAAFDISIIEDFARPEWIISACAIVELIEKSLEISALKEIENESNKITENPNIESFFISLLHEFRTPLTSIFSSLSMLSASSQINSNKYNLLEKNSYRILKLVNNLIDIYKIDSGQLLLSRKNNDIIAILKETIEEVNQYINIMDIKIELNNSISELVIACDDIQIKRVFLNLFSNAVKVSKSGDIIKVSTSCNEKYLKITIQDQGPGLPKKVTNKVFEEFYRVDGYYIREHEGLGAGLYLAKNIINLHQGKLYVSQNNQTGLTLTIKIPIKKLSKEQTNNITLDCSPDQVKLEFSDIYF